VAWTGNLAFQQPGRISTIWPLGHGRGLRRSRGDAARGRVGCL